PCPCGCSGGSAPVPCVRQPLSKFLAPRAIFQEGWSFMDVAYIIIPVLLILVVLASVWLDRWSVPVILVALGTGILFGSDVLNVWNFGDVILTNQAANLALVFILFHGGFVTKRADFKAVALPAGGLATWGVMLTAGALFVVLRWV